MITLSLSLTISLYTPWGVYSEINPSLEGSTKEFNINILKNYVSHVTCHMSHVMCPMYVI